MLQRGAGGGFDHPRPLFLLDAALLPGFEQSARQGWLGLPLMRGVHLGDLRG